MYDTAKAEFRLTHRVELGLSLVLRYLALGCVFASGLEIALKVAAFAAVAFFEAATQLAGRNRIVAEEQRQRLAWLDMLSLQNLLRRIKDEQAEDWNAACEAARQEAVADIQLHRDREMNGDALSSLRPGYAVILAGGGLIGVAADFAVAVAAGHLIRWSGRSLAPYWPSWVL